MEINEIKKRLPILTVLSKYGLKPDKNNHIRCPFHADDKPSCKIYPETGTYHCFGCGATGDQIEFIEKYEKSSKHAALKKATELSGEETNAKDVMGIASKGAAKGKAEDFAGLFARQIASLPRSPKASTTATAACPKGFTAYASRCWTITATSRYLRPFRPLQCSA